MAVKPKKFVDKDGNQLSSIVHEKYVKDSNGNRLSDKITELSTVVAENKDQIDNLRDFVSSNTVKVSQRTVDINLNQSSIKNGESFNLLNTANLRYKNSHSSHYRVTDSYRIDCFLHGNMSNRIGTYYSIIKLTYLSDEDVTGVLLGYIYTNGRMYTSSGKNTSSIDGHNLEEWNYFITSLFNESVATIYDQGMMSAEDKVKLDGISANANHIDIADNLTTDDSTKALSAKQGKLLNDKIKEKASMSNIAAYMNAGDVMPYADVYTFFIEYGSTTYPVHWNTWVESDGETSHTAFCAVHNEGKGTWYIDYKNTEEGLEFVSTYDDASTVPDVILEAVGDKASVDVVDNLTTEDATKALSAKQGKVLSTNMSNIALDVEQIKAVSITYAELKSLRDAGQLVTGRQYRITDYHCTTTQKDTMSADHQFDIIVVADTNSVLNENARACLHDGDTYFSSNGCKLESWQLKYTLLPTDKDIYFFVDDGWKYVRTEHLDDENGFAWCYFDNDELLEDDIMFTSSENPSIGDIAIQDGEEYEIYALCPLLSTSYRGEILLLEDENNNSCFYDFKNILFKRWKITESENYSSLEDFYSCKEIEGITIDEDDYVWCYTFNKWDEENDCYIEGDNSFYNSVYNNKLEYNSINIVFFAIRCYSNTFGSGCHSNTFGIGCHSNTFGIGCHSNTFGIGCHSNTFANRCHLNTFGSGCYSNTFGDNFNSNTFANRCYSNTFGSGCNSNTFANDCHYNTFGNSIEEKSINNNTSKQQFWS